MKRLLAACLLLFSPFAFALDPMQVVPQGSITISVTGSSAATALPTAGAGEYRQIELQNAGTVVVFVEFGASTITAATATGYPILPGMSKTVSVQRTVTHIAAISGSGTQTLYVTIGIGN